MSDEKDKNAPGTPDTPQSGEERTVFMPGGFTLPPAAGQEAAIPPPEPEPEPAPPPPDPEPEPVAEAPPPPAPVAETPPPPEPVAEAPAAAPSEPPPPAATSTAPAFVPHKDAVGIKVGDCLNHIFQVDRFLARGGMGEVYIGCNVNTDEKVAIKVMLPALASDEKVIAMFRKEARTLTKLNHPALVQYRVLAQEPQLHVLYIVTDFIEGTNLGAALGTIKPSPDELAGLLRRLASGLAAAHALGAIHRDMSPDNVILENDDIHEATIIDFGIAKDLDSSSATIVGDGFAGKLNYVAPEQLGDFGREVGPWTDVYSLGLVILAVAQGKNVDMSGSLVDAIDKRRKGPDISAIPGNLRPLVHAMLRPDPKERPRSMADVLAMLEGARIPSPTTVRAEVIEEAARPAPAEDRQEAYEAAADGGSSKPLLIVLAVLLALAAVLAVIWYVTDGTFGLGGGKSGDVETSSGPQGSGVPPAATGSPAALARSTIDSVMPQVPCTWLDVAEVRNGPPVTVAMRGVAGNGGDARRLLGEALTDARLSDVRLDFGDVAQIIPAGCTALNSYRQIRSTEPRRMATTQTRFEAAPRTDGLLAAPALVDLNLRGAGQDFALLGIQPTGEITMILDGRDAFQSALANPQGGITDLGNNRYRLLISTTHIGWSGLMFVTGRGPFDASLLTAEVESRNPDWQRQFRSAASANGWRAEMVWYQTVDQQPG
ncbi:MAG: eukaryotic-like serine/threonine-protein kinase [Sphingomonadales bacterium]|jgi:serine/threonine-protein kinase|nr:eukaryotic-like serine/threonine-protein kinase [Sphingomonadales bacterium]